MTDPYLPEPYLPEPYQPMTQEVVQIAIGDVSVTQSAVILPHGRFPLRGSVWTIQDSTQTTESVSTIGVILAIVSVVLAIVLAVFTCGISLIFLAGLLFLLMKERSVTGFVTVNVVGQGFYHSVQLRPGPQVAGWATHQVNHARALAAAA